MSDFLDRHMMQSGLAYDVTTAFPFTLSGGPFVAVAIYTWGNKRTRIFAGFYADRKEAVSASLAAARKRGVSSYVLDVERIQG